MRLVTDVRPLDHYRLICTFDDGTEKVADITSYMQAEAFRPLQNPDVFKEVKNRQYYIEWLDGDVDLSVDTLWHIGVSLQDA